jgi:micrococcal nuclease
MKPARFFAFLAIIILITNLAYFYPGITGKGIYEAEMMYVKEVLDGDTFKTESESVRLLCINAPEKNKPYYEEARSFISEFQGKEVQALRDREESDRYERKLRFVFLGDRFINKELVENGLAHLYLCEGTRYYSDLLDAEKKAREKEEGMWKKSASKCADCIELLELNAEEEYFTLRNNCNYKCEGEGKDEANHFFEIILEAGEEKIIESKGRIWNNDGDRLFIRDSEGLLFYYEY